MIIAVLVWNSFQPVPGKVAVVLDTVQVEMLKVGCPMAVTQIEARAASVQRM